MRGKGVRFLQGSTLPPNNSLEGTVSGLWMRAAALRDSVRPVALIGAPGRTQLHR